MGQTTELTIANAAVHTNAAATALMLKGIGFATREAAIRLPQTKSTLIFANRNSKCQHLQAQQQCTKYEDNPSFELVQETFGHLRAEVGQVPQ